MAIIFEITHGIAFLPSLPGRNGLDFDLSINYSSGGIRQVVDTWTVEASTEVLGLGWSFQRCV